MIAYFDYSIGFYPTLCKNNLAKASSMLAAFPTAMIDRPHPHEFYSTLH